MKKFLQKIKPKLCSALEYVNVLFILVVIFTFFKLIYFTMSVHSEMNPKLEGSEFLFNKYIISYIFAAIAPYTIALCFNKKLSFNIIFTISIILSILLFCDIIYFRSFESYLSLYNLSQYKNFGVVGGSAIKLIHFKDILLFLDPIFLYITRKYWIKKSNERKELSKRQQVINSIIPLACLGLIVNYNDYFPTTITKVEAGARYSLIGYHYHDISSYLYDISHGTSKKEVSYDIENWFKKKNQVNVKSRYDGQFKGKNVIFIQVESLENFVINRKAENQEITPNLNRILKNSYYFNNIIAQENGGNSSDADFMVNTSLLPIKSGSVGHRFPYNTYNSLPVILRNNGYSSHAIHSGKGYFWNKENFLPNLGFDTYTDIEGMKSKDSDMFFMGLKDEVHLSQVADLAASLNNPYYLFTVTETSHTPFKLPEEMKQMKLSEQLDENIFGKYFQSINYTDYAIGLFLDKLEKNGDLDDTIVVFYGDHEGLHKYNSNSVLKKVDKDYKKYENNNKVPVIIYSKDIKEGKTIAKLGGQVDIMPTVLSLLGVDKKQYDDTSMGTNLLDDRKGYVVDKNGVVYCECKDSKTKQWIKDSLDISSKIIRSNYYEHYYNPPYDFKFNGN